MPLTPFQTAIACVVGAVAAVLIGLLFAIAYGKQRKAEEAEEQARIELAILAGEQPTEDASRKHARFRVPGLSHNLELCNAPVGALGFASGAVALGALLAFLLFVASRQPILTVAAGAVGVVAPFAVLNHKASKVTDKFGDQLVTALPMVTSLLRSGFTANQAIAAVGENLVEPARSEFAKIARELMVGGRLDEAVQRSAERTNNKDMDYFARAIAVQQEQGGELAVVLDAIADSIRARIRLRAQLRAAVALPRMESWVVTALPWILFVYFSLFVPTYVEIFWTEPLGWLALAAVVFLDLTGWAIMRKMTDMDFD